MLDGILFVIAAFAMCVACVFAVLSITDVEMAGSQAIKRDGMRAGARAPNWELADSTGVIRKSPPKLPLQLLIFAGHSLRSFPSVVQGLQNVLAETTDVEFVVVLSHQNEIAPPLLDLLGLGAIPVVTGSRSLYGRYNVRVSPWLMFVDSAGRVRSSSLVNEDWQVARLHQIARLPLESADAHAQGRSRSGRRASSVKV